MSKNQIMGFIIFNIGLIVSGVFIGKVALKYDIDIMDLLPVFASLLVMVGGLLILSILKVRRN
ncbi:MAG: hypothetical protein KGZ96_08370 [Clostridia bacterium]|nr:hypothetical protein [Clostridia bacterium]